ncbi:MAG: asparagine synthase (glutamine-hydrolyzing) [Minwuia sp.]|uniref:asparagine synthase (glutamine-hydrolyzing) n=1 Tax=Minwuia sp. TaxID=2493630 RepID=UPI003A838AA2
MCGIAGVLDFNGRPLPDGAREWLGDMLAAIHHRGPDMDGIHVDGAVGLGHKRLSIIDLDVRSAQPMLAAEGRFRLVFNGEIYNFEEIAKELVEAGHTLRTTGDTEILLLGFMHWGHAILDKLRGMFAFALWDDVRQELFMARDRFGKKPLYYRQTAERLLFASEIKAILRAPGVPREAVPEVVHDYLGLGYCTGEQTAFAGIRRLPPATAMVISADGRRRQWRYWALPEIDHSLEDRPVEDLLDEFMALFDESVALRMIADVPIGCFLSGGVDSSAVVARMAPKMSSRLKTFSVGFGNIGNDELQYAEAVARRYDTEHRDFQMDYGLIDVLPQIIWNYGEPYADSSALVTYALSKEIRRHVTVAVTGDGGDEIFLGYSRYLRMDQKAPTNLANRRVGPQASRLRLRDRYERMVGKFRDEHRMRGYGPALLPYCLNPPSDWLADLDSAPDGAVAERVARIDVDTYLPDDLLVKADIATMAHSLEGRSPFLDHVLAEWAARLPQSKRIYHRHNELQSKALLKQAMEPHVPEHCLYRRKMGFSVPVAHWMANDIADLVYDTLTATRFRERGLIDPTWMHSVLDEHISGAEDHGTRLWTLLCLELWYQTYIDGDGREPLGIDVRAPGLSEGRAA